MVKKLAHKKTFMLINEKEMKDLPAADYTDNWQGRVIVNSISESEIAKKLKIEVRGEYAIKVR